MAQRRIISQTTFVDQSKVGTHQAAGTTTVHVGTQDAHWLCNSCHNQTPIDGNVKHCSMCGNPKDSSEEYQAPTSDHPFLTAAELQARGVDMDHGSDEDCPFCNAKVPPKSEVCPNCGGIIKDAGKTKRVCPQCSRETNALSCPSCGETTIEKTPPPPPTNFGSGSFDEPRKNPWLLIGVIAAAVIVLIVALVLVFSPEDKVGTVAASSWSCSVPQTEYQYNQHSDWEVPAGGDFVSQSMKIHHYKQVYVETKDVCEDKWEVIGSHKETVMIPDPNCEPQSEYSDTTLTCYDDATCDTDDGYVPDEESCGEIPTEVPVEDYGWKEYCEPKDIYRDEPVMQTFYVYNIWEWVGINPLTTQGTDNNIVCPVVLETDKLKQAGNETISCQTAFLIEDKTRTYQPDCSSEFANYTAGSRWNVTLSGPIIQAVGVAP